jgi:hypothetical protein
LADTVRFDLLSQWPVIVVMMVRQHVMHLLGHLVNQSLGRFHHSRPEPRVFLGQHFDGQLVGADGTAAVLGGEDSSAVGAGGQ